MEYITKEQVLQDCKVEGNIVKLPNQQLDRKLYLQVAKALELIGGKWQGGKKMGFVFNQDPTELLNQIAGGESINLKKEFQFFPTPDNIADRLVELSGLKSHDSLLEPSAGQGAIIKAINRKYPDKIVDCYELMPVNQTFIKKISTANLIGDDFLNADESIKYDKIIANPPFSKNQDIDHIRKMYDLLKPSGKIVAIVSKHWQISQNKKETEFKDWIFKINAQIESIQAGQFKESGTQIETIILIIEKPMENTENNPGKIQQISSETGATPEDVKEGIKTETEHIEALKKVQSGELTAQQGVAEIAKVHLQESPDYYDKEKGLPAMEEKLKQEGELTQNEKRAIEIAKEIIKNKFIATIDDFNVFLERMRNENLSDFSYKQNKLIAEIIADENLKNTSEFLLNNEIAKLDKKIEIASNKIFQRMKLGRERGGSAGALNRDIHNLGIRKDNIVSEKKRIIKELERRKEKGLPAMEENLKTESQEIYKTIKEEDGTIWYAIKTKEGFDIYKNGVIQQFGAKKEEDIEEIINHLKEIENEVNQFEGLQNWQKIGTLGHTERTNDFKDYVVDVSRRFDMATNKVVDADLTISKRNDDKTLKILKIIKFNSIEEAKRNALQQVKLISEQDKGLPAMESKLKENENSFKYRLLLRPFSGYYAKEEYGFISYEEEPGYKFGIVKYSKELPIKWAKGADLVPVFYKERYDNKLVDYYNGNVAKITVNENPTKNIIIEYQDIKNPAVNDSKVWHEFQELIDSGEFKIIPDEKTKEQTAKPNTKTEETQIPTMEEKLKEERTISPFWKSVMMYANYAAIESGFMFLFDGLVLFVFNENASHNENYKQAVNQDLIIEQLKKDGLFEKYCQAVIDACVDGKFERYNYAKVSNYIDENKEKQSIYLYLFSQNRLVYLNHHKQQREPDNKEAMGEKLKQEKELGAKQSQKKTDLNISELKLRILSGDKSSLNKSEKDKLIRVTSGTALATAGNKDKGYVVFFEVSESRGYQTDYKHKDFLYIVGIGTNNKISISGITKDTRLKTLLSHWEKEDIAHEILNNRFYEYVNMEDSETNDISETPTPEPERKEAWQMTKDEFLNADSILLKSRQGILKNAPKKFIKNANYSYKDFYSFHLSHNIQMGIDELSHKNSIKQAISEGKPVPAEVLADYPDLISETHKPESEGKEAWQMTWDEFYKNFYDNKIKNINLIENIAGRNYIFKFNLSFLKGEIIVKNDYINVGKIDIDSKTYNFDEYYPVIFNLATKYQKQDTNWKQKFEKFPDAYNPPSFIFYIKAIHHLIISEALSEGKPVPEAVLADYPELKKEGETQPIETSEEEIKKAFENLQKSIKGSELYKNTIKLGNAGIIFTLKSNDVIFDELEKQKKFSDYINFESLWTTILPMGLVDDNMDIAKKQMQIYKTLYDLIKIHTTIKTMADYPELKNEANSEIKYLISTPEHAKEYGINNAIKPLWLQRLWVDEACRRKGIGTKLLSDIETYAIKNDCDVIFGQIAQKAEYTTKQPNYLNNVTCIKGFLNERGYAVNRDNNDFHKVLKQPIASSEGEGEGIEPIAETPQPKTGLKIPITDEYKKRIESEIIHTQNLLNKELSFSEDLQKKERIIELNNHLTKLNNILIKGFIESIPETQKTEEKIQTDLTTGDRYNIDVDGKLLPAKIVNITKAGKVGIKFDNGVYEYVKRENVKDKISELIPIKKGDKVFHRKFGEGIATEIVGSTITVLFKGEGTTKNISNDYLIRTCTEEKRGIDGVFDAYKDYLNNGLNHTKDIEKYLEDKKYSKKIINAVMNFINRLNKAGLTSFDKVANCFDTREEFMSAMEAGDEAKRDMGEEGFIDESNKVDIDDVTGGIPSAEPDDDETYEFEIDIEETKTKKQPDLQSKIDMYEGFIAYSEMMIEEADTQQKKDMYEGFIAYSEMMLEDLKSGKKMADGGQIQPEKKQTIKVLKKRSHPDDFLKNQVFINENTIKRFRKGDMFVCEPNIEYSTDRSHIIIIWNVDLDMNRLELLDFTKQGYANNNGFIEYFVMDFNKNYSIFGDFTVKPCDEKYFDKWIEKLDFDTNRMWSYDNMALTKSFNEAYNRKFKNEPHIQKVHRKILKQKKAELIEKMNEKKN